MRTQERPRRKRRVSTYRYYCDAGCKVPSRKDRRDRERVAPQASRAYLEPNRVANHSESGEVTRSSGDVFYAAEDGSPWSPRGRSRFREGSIARPISGPPGQNRTMSWLYQWTMRSVTPRWATLNTALLVIGLSACVPALAPTPSPAPSASSAVIRPCGTPSPAVADPKGVTSPGNRLGPLLIVSGFVGAGSPAQTPIGSPTKVLIHVLDPLPQPVTISGARCSDGQPLRFWYAGGPPFALGPSSTPVPEQVLAQTGDLTFTISQVSDYPGYMLFTTNGSWRVLAQIAGRDVGEIVIAVDAH